MTYIRPTSRVRCDGCGHEHISRLTRVSSEQPIWTDSFLSSDLRTGGWVTVNDKHYCSRECASNAGIIS